MLSGIERLPGSRQSRLATALAVLALLFGGFWYITQRGSATVTLNQLVTKQEAYSGRQVHTNGIVQRFQDTGAPYYVLADAQDDRVALQPAPMVSDYQGRSVVVSGLFSWTAASGRSIAVQTISPAASS